MAMNDEVFGGNIGLYAYMDKDTGKYVWKTREEAENDNAYNDAEYKYLSQFGMAPGQGDAKDEKEQAYWDKYQRLRGDELMARSRNLEAKMRKVVPATVFRTADGEEFAIANEDLPTFYKSSRYQEMVKSGQNPEQVNGFRAKGWRDANGVNVDDQRDFFGVKSDPKLQKILAFQQEHSKGYLTPNMMRHFGFDTEESFIKERKRNQARAEEQEWQLKQRGRMTTSEMYGNQVGFGGQSLTEKNKGKGNLEQAHNWFNDNLNFVQSWVDEQGQAVEMELGGENGLEELKRRKAAGEPLLTRREKIALGYWGGDEADQEFLNDPETVYNVLRERLTNRERAKYNEAVRGTTFLADVARATSDSARLMGEMAVINTMTGGIGHYAKFAKLGKLGGTFANGITGAGLAGGLHGDARMRKLMADQVRFDPATGDLTVTSKGAGMLEAALKGYGSGALEYVAEQYASAIAWKAAGKLRSWISPTKFGKFTSNIANKIGNSTAGKVLERIASNPTMDAVRRLSKRTGVDLSLTGLIDEAIIEEAASNIPSALFNLEGVNEDGDVFHWMDAVGALVDTLKNAPAMAISIGVMGAGTGVATRSAQGVYNYATDRSTMEDALKQFGFRDEHLKDKSKAELNDMFYGEMRRRGHLVDEGKIDSWDDAKLTSEMKQCGLLPDNDTGNGIPIEQKREAYKKFLKMNGANVTTTKAANAIVKAAARQIMGGMNHANIVERLDADIFAKHPGEFNAEEREQMRKVMALRSLGSGYKYHGNMMGYLTNGFADDIYNNLSDNAKAAIDAFQSQYTIGSTPVPGTKDAQGFEYEKSTFKHPVSKSDWDNNPKGGYVDFGTGIALRPSVDEDGNTNGWRVDVDGMTVTPRGSRGEVDQELIRFGINPKVGLPYGMKSTSFKTLAEARQFAENLSAWQNTEKKRLLSKAKAAEMYYQRIRGENAEGLVLLRSPHDANENIKDEVMDAVTRGGKHNIHKRFNEAKGFVSTQDGKVYVFLDNVQSPYDLLQTIQHEGLHQSVLDTFNGDIQAKQAFLEVLAKDKDLPTWMQEALRRPNNKNVDLEELLAEVAESVNAGPTLFNNVSKALRNATARVNGLEMSEGDIHSMIFDAYKAKRIDANQVKGGYVPTGSYSTAMMEKPVETEQAQQPAPTETAPTETAPTETETTEQPAPTPTAQAPQSAPTAPTAEPTAPQRQKSRRARNIATAASVFGEEEDGEVTAEDGEVTAEESDSTEVTPQTTEATTEVTRETTEVTPKETAETTPVQPTEVKPTAPIAETTTKSETPKNVTPTETKPAQTDTAKTKTEAQKPTETAEVLNIGSVNYIDRNTFSQTGDLHTLNGIDDITTLESQIKIYDRLPYAVAIGAKVANIFRSSGFAETAETARLRHDFQAYYEVIEDLPDSQQKRIAIKNLSASWHAMDREIEHLKSIDKPKEQKAKQAEPAKKERDFIREHVIVSTPAMPNQEAAKPATQSQSANPTTGNAKTDAAIDDLAKLFKDAGLLREGSPMGRNAGMLREGTPASDKEFKRKVKEAVDNIVESEIENGTTQFKQFVNRIFGRVNSIPKFWDLSKPYFHSQWTLAKYEHGEIDSVTYDEAQQIFKAAENGTIADNNTQNKEQDNGRPVNSSQNVSRDNDMGSGPAKSGEVQSQRTDGADGSVGNRVSGGNNTDLRGSEPHEDVVPGKSASTDENSVGGVSGRNPASGDGGRSTGGQTTSVPEVGSPTGERVVSESSPESGDSASDERGERGSAKSTQKTEGGKDSLLKGKNYRIPADGGQIGKLKNERARVQANLEALTILKQIAEENRPAKVSEQEKLALYSGWGGLSSLFNEDNKDWTGEREVLRELLTPREYEMAQRSVQYAHYTPIPVVMGMYAALERLGVKSAGTRMFEAGAGVGHFIGSRPDGLRNAPYIGIEIDPVSARIAKALYPKANIEQVGFQDFVLPANSQDVVIGNPPFSDIKLTDTTFPESRGMSMHNHFIAKQINALRPGGIGVFIVSRYFMDGQNTLTREYIAKQADLIGAIRLPNGVFGRIANTDVVTDIVVFRKRLPGEAKPTRNSEEGNWVDTALEYEYDPDGKKEKGKSRLATPVNKYFTNGHHVAGRMTVVKDSQYNRPTIQVQNWQVDAKDANFNEKVERHIIRPLLEQLPENIYKPERNPSPQKRKQEDEAKDIENGKNVADGINHPALMEGGYYIGEDGTLYVLSKDEWGARKGVKVQNYDEKAEKAAYEKRVKEQQALNPKFKGIKFDRFRHVPDANAKFTAKEQAFLKDYVHLRNVRYDLVALERSATATDEQIETKRKELNEAYETCKKSLTAIEKPQGEFSLNTAYMRSLTGSDPASAQVRGLEEFKYERSVNDEGVESSRYKFKNVKKAAIFNRRVYTPAVSEEQHFDNVKDAYVAGINLTGKVNPSWLAKATGLTEEAIEKDLLESGLAFYDPSSGEWKHAAAYLSGDVKTKLEDATQALKGGDKRMEANIKALESVQPEYLPSNKITVTFGSPILEQEDVSSFIYETLGVDITSARYSPVTGLWDILLDEPSENAELKKNFPTAGLSYRKILNAAINNKSVTIKNRDTDQVDQAATELANQTVKNIRNLWESWWQSDSDIAEGITERFNERYNRYAEAKYDGSVLTFEGLANNLTPYKHQRDAVMRTILTGNVLYNHVVGSGKTNTAILSIMEMRRMGLVKKPCVIVPNSLTQQWRSEILSAYPGANVLAPLSDEFKASERKRLLARIQNGDWDVVVIPHSQLSKIPLQPSVMQQFYEAETAELRAALSSMHAKARGRSRIEKRVQALEERIKRNMESLSKDNTGMFFDTLGIDGIFVDEAHEFKNVPYASSRQVSGMGNAQGSAKALDLLTKVQWMRSTMPEAPISFLSGTPVSNSLVEFYLNMRYMAPDLLRDAGIHNLDSFLEQFVDVTREYEITPAGTYKEKERVRNLKNIGALMMMVRSYMDVVDSDDLKVSMKSVGKEIDIPELEGGAPINVVAKRSPEQRAYFGVPLNRYQTADGNCTAVFADDTIIGRAEAIAKGGIDPSEDNMLKVVGDSMKASLDFRLVDPNAPDFAGSKVNLCVNNVLDTYHKFSSEKGTQIIFCDRGIPNSGKDEIRNELKELKKQLDDVNKNYQKAINKGKTDEEIATEVDEDGESLIDKRERLSAAIIEREGEISSSFSVYEDIKQKLVKQGIPAEQIAFIHDYKKDHQKKRLFEKVNTGEVRVLIGSTAKMGTGVNVQQRICAVHHLDVPWRPADLTQRNGRAIRQGNILKRNDGDFKIKVMYYATERTSDAFRWQTVESKAKGIDLVYKAGLTMNVVEDISEDAVSSEEMKAQSVGSKIHPRSAELNKKTREMNEQRSTFYANRNATIETVKTATLAIQDLERGLNRAKIARDAIRPLERPKGNVYHDVELIDKFNGNVTTFAPQTAFNAREKAEGKKFEPVAMKLMAGQMLSHRGLVFSKDINSHISQNLNGYLTVEDAKANRNAVVYSVASLSPHMTDGILFSAITRALNFAAERVEQMEAAIAAQRKTLANAEARLAEMPEKFEVPAEFAKIEQEAKDIEFVKARNAMTGQEAHYALSVKYGKEGKPVPQYDWADPTDYGEEGVPTPVVENATQAARNAGMLREAMPKRLSKREKAILWGQFNEKEALRYKKNGTIGSRNVINSDKVGLVYDRTEDGNLEEQELFDIEANPGKLTEYQKRFNNATDRPTGEFVVRSEERGVRHEDDMSRTRSTSNGAARTSDGRLDGVAYQNLRKLSTTPSLPEGSQDNPTGHSNGSGITKKAGPLREGLDAHLQARREAMPKMGLEAARANVQAALHREAGESRKAWAKRKTKAVATFVAEKMVDARLPVIHAMNDITGGVKQDERTDIPLAMQTSYGRVFAEHLKIDQDFVNPTLKTLSDNGLDVETLDTYLMAMFAPERNKMILERTKYGRFKGNAAGSGITDEKAAQLLDELKTRLTPKQWDALERAAARVWELNRDNLDRLVDFGVMSEKQAETWKTLSPHYVPLRDDFEAMGIALPYGTSMAGQNYIKAVGRFSEANTSHFGWSILQAKQGVLWAEQNYINNIALNFCMDNASEGDYRVAKMPLMVKKVLREEKGFREEDAVPLRMSVDVEREAIEAFREGGYTIVQDPKDADIFWVDEREFEKVLRVRRKADTLRTAMRHNVVAKVGGRKVFILFNPQKGSRGYKMGMAISRANMASPDNFLWNTYEKLMRGKAMLTTTLSVTFAASNAVKDIINTSGLMLTENHTKALGDMYKNYLPALREVYAWKRGRGFSDSELGNFCQEAIDNGVLTGTWATATHNDVMIKSVLEPLIDMKQRQKFGKEIGATAAVAYRSAKDFLNTASEIPEVGIRLAVYAAMRKNGMSANDATVYAREITVDFNKKGEWSPVTNVIYMFSNAAIQGFARWHKALYKDGKLNTKGAVLSATTFFLIGFFNKMLMAALFSGDDDDEQDDTWKNIPDYAFQRGVPIMLGDHYINVPMQGGLPNTFVYLGSRIYDVMADNNTTVAEAFIDTAKGPLMDSGNFVNGSGSIWQYLAPTIADPMVQLMENKTYTGVPLHARDYGNDATPHAYLGRKNTSEWAKNVAKALNRISGGNDVEAGIFDVYPESVALIGQFFTSQLGTDIASVGQLLSGDVSTKNVPILRTFVKEMPDNTQRYFEAVKSFEEAHQWLKDYQASNRTEDILKLLERKPFMQRAYGLDNIAKRIRKVNTAKNKAAARGLDTADLEEALERLRKMFLEVYYDDGKRLK